MPTEPGQAVPDTPPPKIQKKTSEIGRSVVIDALSACDDVMRAIQVIRTPKRNKLAAEITEKANQTNKPPSNATVYA